MPHTLGKWAGRTAHFFLRLPHVIRQRRELMPPNAPNLTGMYHRSIAYDRFILGWKRFEQLDKEAFR
jgi:hypothetical protein